MKPQRPTVKEIARLAGVSIGTVDRVLHGRAEVAEETRERVSAIAKSIGYAPDTLARQLSLNKSYHFHALVPRGDQDSGDWGLCREGIEEAGAGLSAFRASLKIEEFDRRDRRAYLRLLDSLPLEHCDGLVLPPVFPDELLAFLPRIEGRVPYVFFDGSLDGARPLTTVGQDAAKAGYLAGRMMSLLAPGPGSLLVVQPHAEDRHIRLRIDGFRRRLVEAGDGRPVEIRPCEDLEEGEALERLLSSLFENGSDIAGILVPNASGHRVGEWLWRQGLKEGRAVVAWDLVPANAQALGEGRIDCLISQRPREQGRLALESLSGAVIRNVSPRAEVDLPIELWIKENLPEEEGRGKEGLHGAQTR